MEMQAKINRRIDDIQRRLRECNFEVNELRELFAQSVSHFQAQLEIRMAELPAEAVELPAEPVEAPGQLLDTPVEKSPTLQEAVIPEVIEQQAPPVMATPPPIPPAIAAAAARPAAQRPKAGPAQPPAAKRNMEKFIGENLLNKIGIGILVIGIGIFVKYAIDQDWIGSIGRVLIGLATGGVLLGIAHKLRNSYKSFSSVLMGGGIATLYFSVAIAFQTYGLLSQTASFLLMCAITAFGVLMSVSYNRLEIALIALVGGFATPFMAAQGEGNYVVLFSYLLVLNAGALALSWFRGWQAVRVLAYAFTSLLFGGWMALEYTQDAAIPFGGIGFASAFFVLFFLSNIAFAIRRKEPLKSFDFVLLLSNSGVYYAAVMGILYTVDGGRYMGLFTALVGLFHFLFIYPAKKFISFDKRVLSTLVGLVMTFVTASFVIQLEGRFAATFWAIEAVVLLLLARQTKLSIMQAGSQVVSFLAILALGRNWLFDYNGLGDSTEFLGGMLLTTLVTGASMLLLHFLNKKEEYNLDVIYRYAGLAVLYAGISLQLFESLGSGGSERIAILGVVTFTVYFLAAIGLWARIEKGRDFGNAAFTLAYLGIAIFLAAQFAFFGPMRAAYSSGLGYGSAFPTQLLIAPGLLALLALNFGHARRWFMKEGAFPDIMVWATAVLLVVVLSIQLDNLVVLMGSSVKYSHKIGYPILWGSIGFLLVAMGLKLRMVQLRIVGLSLFLLIILKLFLYDVWSMPAGGKIAAFISLGILLLVASFMYQRLRKLLVKEDDGPAA